MNDIRNTIPIECHHPVRSDLAWRFRQLKKLSYPLVIFGKPIATVQRIAMPRGWTPIDYLPLVKQGKLVIDEADQVESVITMLLIKRVDGIYLNADVATTYLKSQGMASEAEFDSSLPFQYSQYSLSSTLHPEIIDEFNQFLVDSADEIQHIKAGYQFKFDSNPQKSKK